MTELEKLRKKILFTTMTEGGMSLGQQTQLSKLIGRENETVDVYPVIERIEWKFREARNRDGLPMEIIMGIEAWHELHRETPTRFGSDWRLSFDVKCMISHFRGVQIRKDLHLKNPWGVYVAS